VLPGLAAGSPGDAALAVGGHLKVTVALTSGDRVIASHHLGDLDHLDARLGLREAIAHLEHLTGVAPTLVVHDLHPDYASTVVAEDLAAERDIPSMGVQHHHAHLASCLVEHRRSAPVVALCFDGVGFGTDGSLWGGELLVGDLAGFRRVGHLREVALPGGTAAIREPWRMAVAWLAEVLGPDEAVRRLSPLDARAGPVVALTAHGSTSRTTGAGRLFDAVAALVLGRTEAQYEAQGAIELEGAARSVPRRGAPTYPDGVRIHGGPDELVLDPGPLLTAVLADLDAGRGAGEVAAGFHESLGRGAACAAAEAARAEDLATVVLTGGVFQNARLSEIVAEALRDEGMEVLIHRVVPPNDGGLSIGQAAVGMAAAPRS
jgi:hydrogenase maturation protein HypF